MNWSTKRYSFEQEIPLSRSKVWELLSNTDHMNRAIKLFPVSFSPVRPGTFIREAEAKANGVIPLQWKEYPFQWVKNESYSVERVYSRGPFKRFEGGIALRDAETILPDGSCATMLTLFADFTPANFVGLLAAMSKGKGGFKVTFDYCFDYLDLKEKGKENYRPQTKSKNTVNDSELVRLFKELALKPVEKSYIPLLRDHLYKQGDDEVIDMQPYKLAYLWNADEEEVLRLCLYATKLGILNLSWNIMCPNCRVSKADHSSLSLLQAQFHCDLCGVDYQANFDQYVELKFSVHPTIRKAIHQIYCIGGPYISPHIWIQKIVEQGQSADIYYPESNEPFRLRTLKTNHTLPMDRNLTRKENDRIMLTYTDQGWSDGQLSLPIPVANTPLHITNKSSEDIVVIMEKVAWDEKAVTAAKVTAMQEFRDLFSSEVLAPGQQVGVENVTILFSDLLGSTALYETVGDAHAYGQVNRHFDFLTGWIAKNSGSLVKTIGDAVMAVFHLPEHAFKAALDIQSHVSEFNSTIHEDIVIKIGLHSGPAIVVNSNDRLDYFGRTVNIAARIQGESKGGDIVLSEQCYEKEAVRKIMEEYPVTSHRFKAALKGIEGEVEATRIMISSEQLSLD
jgi:adenylate cyclase